MSAMENRKAEFVDAYTKVLVGAWSDEEYAAKLMSDPRGTLIDSGLEVPESTDIQIITHTAANTTASTDDIDRQWKLYESSLTSGHLELHIPQTPVLQEGTLNQQELADVAAGWDPCCCCCCC